MKVVKDVIARERDPITGGWLVTLECGHEKTMEDRAGGIPVGAPCDECPKEKP